MSLLSKAALSFQGKTMHLIFLKASHVYNVLSQNDIPTVPYAAWHSALKPLSVECPLSLSQRLSAQLISGQRNTQHNLKLRDKRDRLLFEQVLETCCKMDLSIIATEGASKRDSSPKKIIYSRLRQHRHASSSMQIHNISC